MRGLDIFDAINTLLFKNDGFLPLLFLHAIERASELAQKAFEKVRGDVVVVEQAAGASLLQGVEHVVGRVRLGEDAGGDLIAATLGGDGVRGAVRAEEEFGVAGGGGAQQRVAVGCGLGDGFAEAEGVETVVNDHEEMVGGDGARDGRTAFLDRFDGGGGREVFTYDPQGGESAVQLDKGRNEALFGGHDCDVADRGAFPVQV